MSEQMKAAAGRAGLAFFVVLLTAGSAWLGGLGYREAISGVLVSLAAIATRFGEGFYDQARNDSGDVHAGDVRPKAGV